MLPWDILLLVLIDTWLTLWEGRGRGRESLWTLFGCGLERRRILSWFIPFPSPFHFSFPFLLLLLLFLRILRILARLRLCSVVFTRDRLSPDVVQSRQFLLSGTNVRVLPKELFVQLGIFFLLLLHFLQEMIVLGSRYMEVIKGGIDGLCRNAIFRWRFERR